MENKYVVSRYSDEDRNALFSKYEQVSGINKSIVEKDYWVTFILQYLFHDSPFKDYFIFKGGTSLSKCFHVINRFSEDIDLILKWGNLTDDDPNKDRSKTQQDKYNKKLNSLAQEFLVEKFVPVLQKDLNKYIRGSFELELEVDKQTVKFAYPRLYKGSDAGILEYIKLEIGPLAALTPTENAEVSPLINELDISEIKSAPTLVPTVTAARTFWEKVTILHQEANRPKEKPIPLRYSRHYYDVYQLGRSKYKQIAFNDLNLLRTVAMFKTKFYPNNWAKYDEAYPPNLKLVPPNYRREALERDYANMRDMIYKNRPDWKDIIDYLGSLEKEINNVSCK